VHYQYINEEKEEERRRSKDGRESSPKKRQRPSKKSFGWWLVFATAFAPTAGRSQPRISRPLAFVRIL